MKVSKNFYIEEFVPKHIYEAWGDKSIWFIDAKIISLAQFVRDYFGKSMTINNWNSGGKFNYRGFRDDSFYLNNKKGLFSQHRFGRAIDFNLSDITPDEIRDNFIKNEEQWLEAGLTTFEHGDFAPTWVHIDIRTTGMDHLKVVKP